MSPYVVSDRYSEQDSGTDNRHGLSCEVCPEHAAQRPQKEADKQCSVEDVLPNFDVIHTAFLPSYPGRRNVRFLISSDRLLSTHSGHCGAVTLTTWVSTLSGMKRRKFRQGRWQAGKRNR